MFFIPHEESVVGYKRLTKPDLGLKPSSHQTHIGLLDGTLEFLPDNTERARSVVLFENECALLPMYFDRIQILDGPSRRSPKIRTGGLNAVSVVSFIRDRAKESARHPHNEWYLFWLGLKSEQVVFFLVRERSADYEAIRSMGLPLPNDRALTARVRSGDAPYGPLVSFLSDKIAAGAERLLLRGADDQDDPRGDAEPAGSRLDGARGSPGSAGIFFDRDDYLSYIGRRGEALVAEYLEREVRHGRIDRFNWLNSERESFRPYDFTVQERNGDILYLDVKSTVYGFPTGIQFSAGEIDFIADSADHRFRIYRVYDLVPEDGEFSGKLRVCGNYRNHALALRERVRAFKRSLADIVDARLLHATILVNPDHAAMDFGDEVVLGPF